MNICKQYTFRIWKENNWYLAECSDGENEFYTQGKSEWQVFDMVADCFATVMEVQEPWWRKLVYRLFKF